MDTASQQITVVGQGVVSAVPDVMRLNAGVEVRKAGAGEAFAGARAAAVRLTRTLAEAGIAAKDLRTSELSLGPEYENYPKVSAYRAAQGVEAVIRDLSQADRIIDLVASIGEEARLNGVSFEISDPVKALRDARDRAFHDARGKAEQYARLSGRPLGQVVAITEEVEGPPRPMMMAAAAAEQSSISPGEQSVSVAVRVVYSFGA
ncbi:SIMPL domain-containing protein [Nonomuraea typhae]|uniref:SIMPL domain-containing protein n=1 Tax=Nonomuraea typhae TaxID=2603600 RepID=UPI001FE8CB8A|nr:SIMPL domain-containing protein [Nonomuraea typhae]